MNIILVRKQEIQKNQVLLSDDRAEHIIKVLKATEGDTVKIGCINGKIGLGRVLSFSTRRPYMVELQLSFGKPAPPASEIDLILALPRPIMLRRILSQVAALGVGKIFLIHASRVEKSFWQASLLQQEEYDRHLIHGLMQAVDTRLPEVEMHRKFRPFVEDALPRRMAEYDLCVCTHPTAETDLQQAFSRGVVGKILFCIGPEGGWVDYEVEKFRGLGFVCCSIGSRILKVDTAVVAVHAQLRLLKEL